MAENQESKTEPQTEETKKDEEYKETSKASMGDFIGGLKQEFFGSYEAPPYTIINTFEVDGKKFEERKYEGNRKWVSTKKVHKINEERQNDMFMSLFNYITGKNETSAKIPMTVPVSMLNKKIDDETKEMEMSFYLDAKQQENPPKPNNPALYITTRPELTVYTRTVGGFMNEAKWKKEMEELDELIKAKELKIDESHYYTNGYDAPFKLWNRRNEVWRVKLDE